jgi:hypothetical protein
MKDHKSMLKKVMLLPALLFLFSCATAQQIQQVSKGQTVDVGSYSLVTPSGEWNVEIDKGRGIVTFFKAKQELLGVLTGIPQGGTIIKVLRNAVMQEKWHLTEEDFADEVSGAFGGNDNIP